MDNVESKLIDPNVLLPILEKEALSKNLKVFVFSNEEVKAHYNVKSEKIAIALLAQDENCALYNLKNLRRCYLIKDMKYAVCDEGDKEDLNTQ